MKNIFLLITLLIIALPNYTSAQNQAWHFPVGNYVERNQYKMFGQYFDKSSYVGKESLFPTQYTGYHAAADLEFISGEENKDVPVYAVTDGKISFIGPVGGYGGVILLNMSNDSHTAIYGHLKLSSTSLKTGDLVKAGQLLANLGKAFSSETGGERKHLHFGIYNGKSSYFKGYETSKQAIQNKWIDPSAYLKEKRAVDVSGQLSPPKADPPMAEVPSDQQGNSNQNISSSSTNANINNSNPNLNDRAAQSVNQSNPGLFSNITQYLKDLLNKIKSIL
jgi:murein DD-endopeptidase MepM/ murein hydrolase activator NlpD